MGRKSYESISNLLSFFLHFFKNRAIQALLSLANENKRCHFIAGSDSSTFLTGGL
jgi:hypothetical protein